MRTGALVLSVLFTFGVFSYAAYAFLVPASQYGDPRAHLYWSGLEGSDRCLSYNIREYTARLANPPIGLNRMDACMTTPIVIHDTTLDKPEWCEDRVRPLRLINNDDF
jgi:hypothetical protein